VQGAYILFEDVHIGLDISESFFNRGYDLHPCVFTDNNMYGPGSPQAKLHSSASTAASTSTSTSGASSPRETEIAKLSARYKSFRNYLNSANVSHSAEGTITDASQKSQDRTQPLDAEERDKSEAGRCISEDIISKYWPEVAVFDVEKRKQQQGLGGFDTGADYKMNVNVVKVLLIQRDKNRAILNLHDLLARLTKLSEDGAQPEFSSATRRTKWATSVVEITAVPFSQQTCLFAEADVLIAVAGTAVHNILFMKPGAAVVSQMQLIHDIDSYSGSFLLMHSTFIHLDNFDAAALVPVVVDVRKPGSATGHAALGILLPGPYSIVYNNRCLRRLYQCYRRQ
jgi:hypothetical protein